MITNCAKALSVWLHKSGAISEDDRELYEYAAYVFLITVLPLLLVVIIGIVTGMLENGVLFIIPFLLLRKFSGGFHTKHIGTCFLLSVCVLSLCMFFIEYCEHNIIMDLSTIGAMISLIALSPVDSENRHLNVKEQKRYRIIVRYIVCFWGIVYFALCAVGKDRNAVCISFGLMLTASLQILCLLQRFAKKRKETLV